MVEHSSAASLKYRWRSEVLNHQWINCVISALHGLTAGSLGLRHNLGIRGYQLLLAFGKLAHFCKQSGSLKGEFLTCKATVRITICTVLSQKGLLLKGTADIFAQPILPSLGSLN